MSVAARCEEIVTLRLIVILLTVTALFAVRSFLALQDINGNIARTLNALASSDYKIDRHERRLRRLEPPVPTPPALEVAVPSEPFQPEPLPAVTVDSRKPKPTKPRLPKS